MASDSDQQISEEDIGEDGVESGGALDTSGIETGADLLLEFLDGEGKNSVSTIADELGVPEKTVKIWGKALNKQGYVDVSYSAVRGMVLKYSAGMPYEELDLGEPKGENDQEDEGEETSDSEDLDTEEVEADEMEVEAEEVETHTKKSKGVHSTTHRVSQKERDDKSSEDSGETNKKKEEADKESGRDLSKEEKSGEEQDESNEEESETQEPNQTSDENRENDVQEGQEEVEKDVSGEEDKIEQANVKEADKEVDEEKLEEELENVKEKGEDEDNSSKKKKKKKVKAKKATVTEIGSPDQEDDEGHNLEIREAGNSRSETELKNVKRGEKRRKSLKQHMREIYEDGDQKNSGTESLTRTGKNSNESSREEDNLHPAIENLKETGEKLKRPEVNNKRVYNELNDNLQVLKRKMISGDLDQDEKLEVRGVMDKLEEDLESDAGSSEGIFSKFKGLLNG